MRRLLALMLCLPALAPAYYHFIRYEGRSGPFNPIVQKFDLSSLPGRTVQYFIAQEGLASVAPGDSLASVTSQIRLAAQTWNDVSTSELRLAFGGFAPRNSVMNAPAIEVVFDELPPGLIALGGPTVSGSNVFTASGQFTPIVRSLVVLNRDLSQRPSYSEGFFLTAVHELGHALGLQHSWASGVMSTEITRGTTKALPLAADDIAGISALYPAPAFSQLTGNIAGRVNLGGAGVNLASVVAVSPTGPAVSALTHPDGTYRIEGIPPGVYYVYAHPIPPALAGEMQPVNLVLPTDGTSPFLPGPAFDLQFYPQGRTPNTTVFVSAGGLSDGINFDVNARSRVTMHSAQTYSFYSSTAVKPAHVLLGSLNAPIIFFGFGFSNANGPLPGLNISTVGSPETFSNGVSFYSPVDANSSYLRADVQPHPFSVEGPKHLLFALNGESYVLPAAFRTVARRAPSITSVTPEPDRSVVISGTELGASTRILFDGVAASVRQAEENRLVVQPPPAASGHRSVVVALNPDGQSSIFQLGSNSPSYSYDAAESAQFTISPTSLPTGVETVVEITGTGTRFAEGLSRLGFGTSDVVVRRLHVVSPTRMLAQVMVAPNAVPGASGVTAVAGLHVINSPLALQVVSGTGFEKYVPLNSLASATYFTAGAAATLPLTNVPDGSIITVTVSDRPAPVGTLAGGQVTFQIPAGTAVGAAVVRITANGEPVLPAVIRIDPPPAVLLAVQTVTGQPITASNTARPGELVQLVVGGLTEAGFTGAISQLKAASGSLTHNVFQVQNAGGVHLVQVQLNPLSPTSEPLAVTLSVDGRAPSQSILVPIR